MFKGRLNRSGYAMGFVYIILLVLIVLLVGGKNPFLIAVTIWLLFLVLSIPISVRRWHDLGGHGALTILVYVFPPIGLYVMLGKGIDGPNQYGAPYSGKLNPLYVFGFKHAGPTSTVASNGPVGPSKHVPGA